MFYMSIIVLTILIAAIQSLKPSLKLTFSPDEKYYTIGNQVEIHCEVINPSENMESAQLWHIDYQTGKHTPIGRSLLYATPEDAPEVFKQNKHKRLEFIRKNYIRIRQLIPQDSAKYECNCPDCEEPLPKQTKDLQVMKLIEPKWLIEPNWPLQEHSKTIIKCIAEDFYPYVSHKIIRNHHDITNEGKSVVPYGHRYPQNFSWEATVVPTADWHNTSIRCVVVQGTFFEKQNETISAFSIGNTEQHAIKNLEVIFTPRFLKCDEIQHVNSMENTATIECSYAGNPAPKLTWLRQTDEKPIASDIGITIAVEDKHHGKYKSIVTFHREKLEDNYYQQLLNDGFNVRLSYNNDEKGAQNIHIISDIHQIQSNPLHDSACKTMQHSSLILCLFLIILNTIQHY
jgi:hypothetical protein